MAFCIRSIRPLIRLVLSLIHQPVIVKLLNLGYLVFIIRKLLLFAFLLVFVMFLVILPFLSFLLLLLLFLKYLVRRFICIRRLLALVHLLALRILKFRFLFQLEVYLNCTLHLQLIVTLLMLDIVELMRLTFKIDLLLLNIHSVPLKLYFIV